jgi:hypothetical protein
MTLTAQLFQQILTSLRSDTGRRFNEQRLGPRVGVRGRIKLLRGAADLAQQQPPIEVWVRDISISGIGLLSSEPMTSGARFRAQFPKADEEPLTLLYTVVHCKSVSKGLYVIGARLADVPQSQAPRPTGPFATTKTTKSAKAPSSKANDKPATKESPAESAAPPPPSATKAPPAPASKGSPASKARA